MQTEQKTWITYLRVVACFAMVLAHSALPLLSEFSESSRIDWWVGNVYDGAMRFCVPVFFMISGALLLPKPIQWGSFYKRRFLRLLPPLIFWGSIYIAVELLAAAFLHNTSYSISSLSNELFSKLQKGGQGHFWFVYVLAGIYLLNPLLKLLITKLSRGAIRLVLVVWIGLFFLNTFGIESVPFKKSLAFVVYIGYYVLGYYLLNNGNKFINSRVVATFLFLGGTAVTLVGTFYLTEAQQQLDHSLYELYSPFIVLASVGVFVWFKNTRFKPRTFVNQLAEPSYGVYLCHMLPMYALNKVGVNANMMHPVIAVPIVAVLCFSVSTILITLLRKFKPLSIVVG